jgi:hypothetical protein
VVVLILPIYGQKTAGEKQHDQKAAKTQQKETPHPGGIAEVNKPAAKPQEQGHKNQPDGYFDALFSPNNIPNVALALVGIIGIIVALRTLNWLQTQTRAIERQANLMERQADHMRDGLVLTRQSADAARDSANAAQDSAKITRQQLEASSRPWIIAAVSNAGPLIFTTSGAQLAFDVVMSNVGHSPALSLRVYCEVVVFARHLNIIDRQKQFVEEYRLWPQVLGATLFPQQEPQAQRFTRPALRVEVGIDPLSQPYMCFIIIGCVGYRSDMGTDALTTCFAYDLVRLSETGDAGGTAFPGSLRQTLPADRLTVNQRFDVGMSAK